MPITKIITSSQVQHLKQAARKLKRKDNLTHTKALDVVAQRASFNHWHHVTLSNNLIKPAEDAFRSGIVMIFDFKESDCIDTERLIEDHRLAYTLDETMFEIFANTIDVDDEKYRQLKDTLTPEELCEYFDEEFENYVFYRLSPSMSNFTIEEAVSFIRQHSFWMPRHLWLKSVYFDTYSLEKIDEDDNLLSIRL